MSDQQPPVPDSPQQPEESEQPLQPEHEARPEPPILPQQSAQQAQQPAQAAQPVQPAQPAQAEPQWIPIPQHPYAQAAVARPGKGLGIAAMAVGLVALLTTLVSAFYFNPLVALGALLGVAAVVLGIIALVKRQRPIAPGATGLAAGALAIVVALVVGALSLGALAINAAQLGAAGSDSGSGGTSEPSEEQQQEVLLEWPANMATGSIFFGEGLEPALSDPLLAGEAPVTSEVNREGGVLDIRLYVDYRCPYCMIFEETNGDDLAALVSDGSATLELVPLTFLDRVSDGTYYSSRAAAAVQCIVDSQPSAAWSAHTALLSSPVQPGEGSSGLSNEELIGVLDDATGGLTPAVRDCISTERFVTFAQALNTWVFQSPIPNAVDPTLAVTGTPFVVVNGIPYEGDPSDNEMFRDFLLQIAGY